MQTRIKTSREIGEKIKRRRKELRISQEELAERIGVTYQQVQRYENGMNRLNVENIQIIANTLNVPVSYFFEDVRKDVVAEESTPYLPVDESKLLNYFRKIREKNSQDIVLKVTKLIAKVKDLSDT